MNAELSEREFQQVTGINFVDYVAHARFKNACDLLRNPRLRISEIAFAVGFQSLSQFNRVFKRFAGKSPTQYRAAKRMRPAASVEFLRVGAGKNPKKCVVNNFWFLRILAIRVAFETNSMDPR